MRVAVLGAGMTGLAAAHRLSAGGHAVDVYERWPGLGGQVATMALSGASQPLERYYHHLFPTDRHIAALYAELGEPGGGIAWLPSTTAVFAQGALHPFTTPLDLLRFRPLPPLDRLRMGAAVVLLQRLGRPVERYERVTARDWVRRHMGRAAWDVVWGPLLAGKFGPRAGDVSMAWLWSKLTLRRPIAGETARGEVLGYPRGSWQPLLEALRARIEGAGGKVLVDRPAARLDVDGGRIAVQPAAPGSHRRGHDPRAFAPDGPPVGYDGVIATLPGRLLERLATPALAAAVTPAHLRRLTSVEHHAALCLLLELDRSFSPYYWTNVSDRALPFIGLVEHTQLVGTEPYGGRHLLYVANYRPPGDALLGLDADALLAAYEPGLRAVRPDFERAWARALHRFIEPDAQPVVTPGYRERMPPLATPLRGLVVATQAQIYPEDRGTNYAVELGERAASALVSSTSGSAIDGVTGALR